MPEFNIEFLIAGSKDIYIFPNYDEMSFNQQVLIVIISKKSCLFFA